MTARKGPHIVAGQFQSDKYPTCPPGKVPLSVKDGTAQDLLWEYAQRRRSVDAEFAADLEFALKQAGYQPAARYAVVLEPGVWLASWAGDPGRTLDLANAALFATHYEARVALGGARHYRPFEGAMVQPVASGPCPACILAGYPPRCRFTDAPCEECNGTGTTELADELAAEAV